MSMRIAGALLTTSLLVSGCGGGEAEHRPEAAPTTEEIQAHLARDFASPLTDTERISEVTRRDLRLPPNPGMYVAPYETTDTEVLLQSGDLLRGGEVYTAHLLNGACIQLRTQRNIAVQPIDVAANGNNGRVRAIDPHSVLACEAPSTQSDGREFVAINFRLVPLAELDLPDRSQS